jgi:hypothetical protein
LELARYAFPEEDDFLVSRLGLARGNAVRDVAPIRFKKDDVARSELSPFGQVSNTNARPVKVEVLLKLQKGHVLAREVKNYFAELSTHYATAAPLLPTIVDMVLTKKNHDELFNGLVATLSLTAAVAGMFSPVPHAVPLALNTAKVVTKLTWDTYNLANKPPDARSKSTWAQWSVLAMDTLVDIQYAQLRKKLRTAKKKDVDELVKVILEGKSKFRVDGKTFIDTFKMRAAQEILQRSSKRYYVYRCKPHRVHAMRCGGKGHKITTLEGDAWFTSDIEEGAYSFLKGLTSMNWDNFFLGKDGWALPQHNFSCLGSICTGPKWPRVKTKTNNKKPGVDVAPDKRTNKAVGVFDVAPHLHIPTKELTAAIESLVPKPSGNDKIYSEYVKEKKSIQWLVERALPGVDFMANMGLKRDNAAHQMHDVAALALESSKHSSSSSSSSSSSLLVAAPSKEVTDHLQKVLEIGQLIKTRMAQIEIHYAASNSLVRIAVTNLLTPEDHVKILRALTIASIAVSFAPSFIGSAGLISSIILGQIRRRTAAKPPPVKTLEEWTEWSAKEVDLIIDIHYECIRDELYKANAEQLALFHEQLEEGAFKIEAREFLQGFQTKLAQEIMNNVPKYTVSKCLKHCREGHPVKNAYYKVHIPTNALKHLDSIPIQWESLFLGQDGWKLADGGEYTCHRGAVCPIWVARQGTCQRCSGVKWTYRVRRSGVRLNGAVIDFHDLTLNKESKNKKKRWHMDRLKDDTQVSTPTVQQDPNTIIVSQYKDTPIMAEFKKSKKPLSWLADQYKLELSKNLGMARHLVPFSLTEEFTTRMLKSDAQALTYFQAAVYLANTFHERINQVQVHYAAAAATVPDIVKYFIQPSDKAQIIWIAIEAIVGASSLAFKEVKWIWRVTQMVKGQIVDPLLLDPKKPTQGDFRSWDTWSVLQMDKAADHLYAFYEKLILTATATEVNNLEEAAMAGVFVLDPQAFLRDYRTMVTQGILAAHPKYTIKQCSEKDIKECFEGVVFNGQMYKDNLKVPFRKFLRDELHVDWESLYTGKNGWNMQVKPYTCPLLMRKSCPEAVMLKGMCRKCRGGKPVTEHFINKRAEIKQLATGEMVTNSIDQLLEREDDPQAPLDA